MRIANCPSCGAPVEFRSTASILAVCGYCKSTLIRHDLELENLGRMADLMEDASPLQLGAEGRYRNSHFALIGRIQLRYQQGVWNEWHLLFDNQESGWLSEANGNYVLTFPSPAPENIPAFETLEAGRSLQLHGQAFQIVNKETSTCIAGEGELPFKVGAGYEAPVIDLSNEQNFATLDYSETPPLLYIGEQIELGCAGHDRATRARGNGRQGASQILQLPQLRRTIADSRHRDGKCCLRQLRLRGGCDQ